MPFGGKKAKGFNLDCVLGNVAVTVVTCCGYVFQGTIEDDNHTRAQYGCPIVFPAMTMDYGHDKDDDKDEDKDDKKCDKKDDKKDDKKFPCPKPIEVDVDVKCENDPKFICLRLTCQPGNICCPATPGAAGAAGFSFVTAIAGSGGGTPSIFLPDDTVLINVADIVAIGPSRTCLTPA